SLTCQFVDDILDAVASDPHAGPHAIDPAVAAGNGDFRAVAGFTGNAPDLDHAVGNFRNFLLEESLHEAGGAAAEDHLHAAAGLADFVNGGPHAFVGVMGLARYLFAPGQDRLDVAEGDGGSPPFVAL